ncbi:hypothetical protein L1887_59314 [Cichorium endivia]|nr:hypothetical protein L1887_59314 [Cichorium endivia]
MAASAPSRPAELSTLRCDSRAAFCRCFPTPSSPASLLALILYTLLSRRRYVQLSAVRPACVQHRDGGAILLALLHLALVITLLGLASQNLHEHGTLLLPSLALETLSALIIACTLAFHRPARATPIVTLLSAFLLFSSLFAAVQLRTFYFVTAARRSAFLPVFAADFGTRWLLFLTLSTKPFDPRQTSEERASFVSKMFFIYLLPSLWRGLKKPIELDNVEPLADSYASRTLEAELYRQWHASAEASSSPGSGSSEDEAHEELSYLDADAKSHHSLSAIELASRGSAGATSGPARLSFLPRHPSMQPKLVHASLRAFAGVLFSPLPSKALYTVMVLLQPLLVQETLDFISSYSDPAKEPKPAAYGYGIAGAFFLIFLLLALSQGHFTFSIYKTTCKLRGALVQAVYDKTLVLSVDALQDTDTPSPTVMQSVDIERIVGGLDPFHEIWSAVVIIIVALYLLWQQIGPALLATIVALAALFASIPLMTKDAKANQEKWSKLTDERTSLVSAAINAIKAVKQSALEGFLITKLVNIRKREVKALVSYVANLLWISLLGNVAGDILLLATITTFAVISALHQGETRYPFTTTTVFTTITIIRIIERPLFIIGRRYASVISAVTSLKRLQTFLLLAEQAPGESDTTWSPPAEKVALAASAAAVFEGASLAWKTKASADPASISGPETETNSVVSSEDAQAGNKAAREGPVLSDLTLTLPRDRYQQALLACGLVVDVQQLPKGDDTLAKHLSGGQKQRVALCRAVYADEPTYVLDDVLSAVDATTAASINLALFSRQTGLLRNKTIVMATNSVQQMQLADHIVQMAGSGGVKMLHGEAQTVLQLADTIDSVRRKSEEALDDEGPNGESSAAAEIRAAAAKERKLLEMEEEQEEVMTGRIKFSVLKRYFGAAGWWVSLSYPLALTIQTGAANGQLLWLQAWAQDISPATLRGSIALHVGILALLAFLRFTTYGGSLVIYLKAFLPSDLAQAASGRAGGPSAVGRRCFLNLNPALLRDSCVGWRWRPRARCMRSSRDTAESAGPDDDPGAGHAAILLGRDVDAARHVAAAVLLAVDGARVAADLAESAGHGAQYGAGADRGESATQVERWTAGCGAHPGDLDLERPQRADECMDGAGDRHGGAGAHRAGQASGGGADGAVPAVSVRFENVTVGYGGSDGPMSLRGVSFSLQPGERLGVCGRSGSGKSTMLLSLLRILEPAAGRILVDGADVATMTGDSVRRNISYIPQEPMMLPSLTVRENLDPEGEHTDDEAYWNVLRQTSMYAAISQLDKGLDEDDGPAVAEHGPEAAPERGACAAQAPRAACDGRGDVESRRRDRRSDPARTCQSGFRRDTVSRCGEEGRPGQRTR